MKFIFNWKKASDLWVPIIYSLCVVFIVELAVQIIKKLLPLAPTLQPQTTLDIEKIPNLKISSRSSKKQVLWHCLLFVTLPSF